MELEFRLLKTTDDRSQFYSGNTELDRFFQRYAGQNQFKHYVGSTYVLCLDTQIVGFATVSAGEICAENLADPLKQRFPNYPLPILRIARLAIAKNYQGLGLGKKLLRACLELALTMKESYGCIGVIVDAKAESIEFYKNLGFISLPTLSGKLGEKPQPETLFLAIRTIEKTFNA